MLALLARRGVPFALAVPLLVALQSVLAWISESVHGVGVPHGLNALVIVGLTGYLTGEAWRAHRASSSRAEAAAPAA